MRQFRSCVYAAAAVAGMTIATVSARAEAAPGTVFGGSCRYSDQAARYRHETALILCDTASISRGSSSATFEFSQRSWGSMARFSGPISGNRMRVDRVAIRGGAISSATGSCEIFYRQDGKLSAISCLAKWGARSAAANFLPSRVN